MQLCNFGLFHEYWHLFLTESFWNPMKKLKLGILKNTFMLMHSRMFKIDEEIKMLTCFYPSHHTEVRVFPAYVLC